MHRVHAGKRDQQRLDPGANGRGCGFSEQEVAVPPSKLHTDTGDQHADEHGSDPVRCRRAGGLVHDDADESDDVARDGRGILGEDRSRRRVGGQHDLVEEIPTEHRCLRAQLAHHPEQRDRVEDRRGPEHQVGDRERFGRRRIEELIDPRLQREQGAGDEHADRCDEGPEVCVTTVAERVSLVGGPIASPLRHEEQYLVADVGEGLRRLGRHRGRSRDDRRGRLRPGGGEVGHQRDDDGSPAARDQTGRTPDDASWCR